mgnify:CR=1 FL=1
MKITLRLVGHLKLEGVENGDAIDVAEGTTVRTLLDQHRMAPHHQRYVVPIVNGEEQKLSHVLEDGDELSLFLPIGGG